MMSEEIVIGVAAHKQYQMPNDKIYLPIQVGSAGKGTIAGYQRDDTGDNISIQNPQFSELTATYWLWKNVQGARYKGLVHYRRHFTNAPNFSQFRSGSFKEVMTEDQVARLLDNYEVVLPQKRNYYIETLWSHYEHSHNIDDLKAMGEVIKNKYPEYYSSFETVMSRKKAHMFNMFIMRSDLFDEYCKWMFSILFEVQQVIDVDDYDRQEARVFGYLSELLLDVWLDVRRPRYIEKPVMFMEKQQWSAKIIQFLIRKVKGGSKTSAHMGD